jgi:hypothetical protein
MLAPTTLLTPMSVLSLAGRVTPHDDRDAQQLADARERDQLDCQPSTFERLQALVLRTQSPAIADCGCAA